MLLLSGGRTFPFSAKENISLQDLHSLISRSCTFAHKQTTVLKLFSPQSKNHDKIQSPKISAWVEKGKISVGSRKLTSSSTSRGVANSRGTVVPLPGVTAHWLRPCLVPLPGSVTITVLSVVYWMWYGHFHHCWQCSDRSLPRQLPILDILPPLFYRKSGGIGPWKWLGSREGGL